MQYPVSDSHLLASMLLLQRVLLSSVRPASGSMFYTLAASFCVIDFARQQCTNTVNPFVYSKKEKKTNLLIINPNEMFHCLSGIKAGMILNK